MKMVLISPSSIEFTPYVRNYIKVFEKNDIEYELIFWDRFCTNLESPNVYTDGKKGHRRNMFDYLKYIKFVKGKLKRKDYDKVVIFGIQLMFFMQGVIKKYKGNYIFDIRDRHKLIKYMHISKIINNSYITVLSSPFYKEWLPISSNYVLNHNFNKEKIETIPPLVINKPITISFIGATRDVKINLELIDSLANREEFNLIYNGEGIGNEPIISHISASKINNVKLTGRYNNEDLFGLYNNADLINVLRYNDSQNNFSALPNRLYDALYYGKPLLAFKGTRLSELIEGSYLGLALESVETAKEEILRFFEEFDNTNFLNNRNNFLNKAISDNRNFEEKLISFAGKNK